MVFSLVFLKLHSYSGCDDAPKKNKTDDTKVSDKKSLATKSEESPAGYDLSEPRKIDLVKALDEISGIAYYPKDSSVFAISDDAGSLYKISLNRNNKTIYWRFDKTHDFEDIVLHDSIFYVLISNGNIEKLKFNKDSLSRTLINFPNTGNKINEFESLYFDNRYGKLVLLCKNCEEDIEAKKQTVSAFGFNKDSMTWLPDLFKVAVKPLMEKLNLDKLHLKPSAAAVNPITNDLFILTSENKLLVVMDRNGLFKNVYQLDPALFNQPGGLAFTPSGDMLISNEASENGSANILIYKYQKEE